MKRTHLWRRAILISLLAAIALILSVNYWVTSSTQAQIYGSVNDIPHRKVGLLLGTSKTGKRGGTNFYYKYRIDAAVALYKAGKIDYILVSGDNGSEGYDEPTAMNIDLIAGGVPANRIVLDYAGFRTLDSILRCLKVFGESNITIISQPFHNERALFIANHKDVSAIAFNARDISRKNGILVQLREKLARVKMLLDLGFNKGPKFYGSPIKIG